MSFLWHGLTEQGAQVPVQVDAQGRVIAVDGTPGVSNWERTGTTLSPAIAGDSVTAQNLGLNGAPISASRIIDLGTIGGATAVAGLRGVVDRTTSTTHFGINIRDSAGANVLVASGNSSSAQVQIGGTTGAPNITLNVDGSAEFVSDVKIGGTLPSAPNISLNANGFADFAGIVYARTGLSVIKNASFGSTNPAEFSIGSQNEDAVSTVGSGGATGAYQYFVKETGDAIGHNLSFNQRIRGGTTKEVFRLNANSNATFTGNVTAANITFRSADPAFYVPNERSESYDGTDTYIGPEMNLLEEIVRLEALVKHLYDVLRQNPPAGWDVWDGDTDLIKSRGSRPQK